WPAPAHAEGSTRTPDRVPTARHPEDKVDEDKERPDVEEPRGRRGRRRAGGPDAPATGGESLLRPAEAPAADDGLLSPPDSAVPGREGVGRDETGAPVVTRPSTHPVLRVLGVVRVVLDRVLAALCVVMFVLLVAIVTWQVFTRQVMNDPATWTEESARYTFVVLALLATAYVFSERGHIAVEILVEKLPAGVQKVIASLVQVTIIFFAAYV